ncbi:AF4/FMR2 family member 1 isoform X2 [Aquarana catesbeiana]|uniref:AF4/FMR2 family member 1 isoform X2 n=1 Tax=Aquarana catesbeiana TaxID=8400 RepID=UPI003CC9B581
MAAQSSLYNEERNLLRIRERERRNQEILQERHPFSDHAPLFPEPYKTRKGDELSSRIQSMLGNYEEVCEEVKELIGVKSCQDPIHVPSSALPVSSPVESDKQHSYHSTNSRSLGSRQRPHTGSVLSSNELRGSHSQSRVSLQQRTSVMSMEKSVKQTQEGSSAKPSSSPASISALSPLLSSLSPPVEPLSPLHSSNQVDSKPRGGQSHAKSHHRATKSPILSDTGNREGTATTVANLVPSSQTFPKYLTNSTLPPKPTAYVRPMDGQDQVPTHSPDLKPLQEDYHEESFGSHVDLKPSGKDKFSKLASESYETFTNEAHCVEEILKEMTHSWPPPLTAIHTPSTTEPSKFAFPNKESQQVSSVKVNQKQHDTSSKVLPSPQEGSSMLEADLQLSDSEDSDEEEEEITEKPLSSSAPSSVVPSQVGSVASAHSGSVETEASETESSSDTESESGSSDGEENKHDTQPSDWQLGNFMVKPAALAESLNSTVDHEQEGHWESKEHDSLSSPLHDSPKTVESHHEKVNWTSQEDIQNNPSFPESPIVNETITPRQTVGIKQPKRPVKASFQNEPKGGLTVESEPQPYRPRDQPSKERPTVKTKVKTKPNDYKEPNTIVAHSSENKKHRSSHHSSSTKKCPSTQTDKKQSALSLPQCPSGSKGLSQSKANHRTNPTHPAVVVREDSHRDKVLLPIGDNRLPPPIKNSHKPLALIVKIELSLLSRIPGSSGKVNESKSKNISNHDSHSKNKEKPEKTHSHNHGKEHAKRKVEVKEKNASHGTHKKMKLDNDTKASSSHKESLKKVPKISPEDSQKEHRHQKLISPTQPKKPEKMAHKRHPSESSPCRQQSTTSGNKSSSKEHTTPKQRKVEETSIERPKSSKSSTENNANPFPVPSLPNGTAKPTRPQLKFEEKLYSPEHYMKEAKKLKHKADVMSDKIGKSFNYLDAAMFFIECGIAMEADVNAPKPAYTMFAETVDLIKFIMKLKNFSDSSAPAHEKAFAVICMRCQSVLYMAMFRYKKDTALKYSRTLGEHFKSSSRAAQAPSPCVASSGTPSPMSPTPSPASSGGSQPGSNNSGSQSNSVTIPQMIHHIASSYVNITSYILYAYDIWEQADLLAKKNKDFFADLSAMVCPLALNSTMTELVHYTRQGLQWLRLESNVT